MASDLRRHNSLRPNLDIKLGSCFAENCVFPADGVDPDWAQQVAASDLGRYYLLRPKMEINLHCYFAEHCWLPGDGVDPDYAQWVGASDRGRHYVRRPNIGYALKIAGKVHKGGKSAVCALKLQELI